MPESKAERKEIIRQYKDREKQIGIFVIRNNVTGKVFLDQALNLDVAFNKHRFELNLGSHRNKALQADWTEYGEGGFAYEVIERLEEKPDDSGNIQNDLKELKELCRERLAALPDFKGFY